MSDQANTNDANQGQADGLVTQLRPQVIEADFSAATQDFVVTPPRRMPRRIVTIPLPAPYDIFSITAWLNFPRSVKEDFNSGVEERIRAALMQIVQGHDIVDYDGQPYPPTSDPAFWEEIPNDLGFVIVTAVNGQMGKLSPTNAGR